jgi:Transposase DDE domain group 1
MIYLAKDQIAVQEGTFEVKRIRRLGKIVFAVGGPGVVSHAGGRLLVETAGAVGLDAALSTGLASWRLGRAVHDPGKMVLDLAVSVAMGGRCPADVAALRAVPGVFGPVASDATVSRLVAMLVAGDGGQRAEAAIWSALAQARAVAWRHGGVPAQDGMIVLDPDATLVTAYSAKQGAAKTFKKTLGHHPLLGYLDHGAGGTGEPVATLLRPGNAGSNTAADHITVLERALAQLPAAHTRRDKHGQRPILVRCDGAGATHRFLDFIHAQGMQFSVRFTLAGPDITELATTLPADAWAPARHDPAGVAQVGEVGDEAWLRGWPPGSRLIVRREHPSSGARHRQLSICEVDAMRYTAILTNTPDLPADHLEHRHRLHARVEDRIKDGKDTGLDHLPYPDLASNRIWLAIVALAQALLAFTARLALPGRWRTASPKTLRHRLFTCAGRLVHTGRRTRLDLAESWPWTPVIIAALTRLAALPNPG